MSASPLLNLVIIGALTLASTASLAESSIAVEQYGDHHELDLLTDGDDIKTLIRQEGSGHQTNLLFSGSNHDAYLEQSGQDHVADIRLQGSNHSFTVLQG